MRRQFWGNKEAVIDLFSKFNDRGLFKKGRIIDLSFAAAKRIRMISKGVLKVRRRSLP
jgi:rare lipoprotein A